MNNNYPIVKNFTIFIVMASLPYAYLFYKLLPKTEIWETWLGTIDAGYFQTVRIYGFYVLERVIPLAIWCILFTLTYIPQRAYKTRKGTSLQFIITTLRYVNIATISWIASYSNRLLTVINNNVKMIDEWSWIYSLPVTITIIITLSIARRKANMNFWNQIILSTIDELKEKLK